MGWKSAVFLMVPFWSWTGVAQTIEMNGRTIRLQSKPSEAFWKDPSAWELERSALPSQVDLTSLQTPVKDQGNRGSCTYFTTIALFEHALKLRNAEAKDVNLSEQYLIYANKALDRVNSRDDGSYLNANIRTFLRRGILLEEQMPYSHSWFEKGMPCAQFQDDASAPSFCRTHFPPQPTAQAALFPAERYAFQVDQLKTLAEVRARLAEGQAVTISVPVNQKGWAGPDGLVQHNAELEAQCKTEPDLCGGHTVLLTGYDDTEQVYYFKNSWGSAWGRGGYGKMPYDFAQNWSYGSFFAARVQRLDGELTNSEVASKLGPVQANVRRGIDAEGQAGFYVSLAFDYEAPLGTFYYVSLFPQIKTPLNETESSYQPVYVAKPDGSRTLISDRRFVYSQTPQDLSHSPDRPLELFIADKDLAEAGVADRSDVFLRPSIYKMTDRESYQVLYRDYLAFPAL